jgi:hypothetical protein
VLCEVRGVGYVLGAVLCCAVLCYAAQHIACSRDCLVTRLSRSKVQVPRLNGAVQHYCALLCSTVLYLAPDYRVSSESSSSSLIAVVRAPLLLLLAIVGCPMEGKELYSEGSLESNATAFG